MWQVRSERRNQSFTLLRLTTESNLTQRLAFHKRLPFDSIPQVGPQGR